MDELIQNIKNLAEVYSANLKGKIEARTEEMKADDNSHYLIYRVLGISLQEGQLIDQYQNTGRFLYKYAGSFLEEAATLCLNYKFPDGIKTKVENDVQEKNLIINSNIHISTNVLKEHFPIGTELDVFYNPQNPDKSYVMRFVKNPAIKVLFFIGLLFIVLAFIGLAFLPK